MSRSSAPNITMPEPMTAPAPTYSYEEEGPARIGYGFAPPVEASEAVHLHISSSVASMDVVHKLYSLCKTHSGTRELWLHLDNGQEMVQLKVSASFSVDPCPEFCDAVTGLLGFGNVQVPGGVL